LLLFPGMASTRWSTAVQSAGLADIIIAAL
jgi:hypothetical protein